VLVWPDLVFVEFIAAMLFTFTLFILSVLVNAPLLDQANGDVTPNPSKAPWYLLNLQELLLHMQPALAGIIIPTVWLGILAAFPYFDQENGRQGVWFGTENAIKLTVISAIVGVVGTVGLILWDSGKLAEFANDWFGLSGGDTFRFLENVRAIQNPENLPWPAWSYDIPYSPWEIKLFDEGNTGQGATSFQHLDFPAFLVEQAIPIAAMIGLPCLLIYSLWRAGLVFTRRDALIVLFSGFVASYGVLTIAGTAFRGQDQELVFPWELKVGEGIPGEE
jgi:quinol-cytochrome oxidoreductase complex cytochrome b subunit